MISPTEPKNSPVVHIAGIDEILQVMYWLRGEGLASVVSAADLSRWVGFGTDEIGGYLERMTETGLVQLNENTGRELPTYQLTPDGGREGGRRFADEFADVTRPGHGECADRNCDCQRTGDPADCAHRHHTGACP